MMLLKLLLGLYNCPKVLLALSNFLGLTHPHFTVEMYLCSTDLLVKNLDMKKRSIKDFYARNP